MNIKETLLSTLRNGKEVMNEIKYARKSGLDITIQKGRVDNTINQIHPKMLNLVVQDVFQATDDAKTIRFVAKDGYLPPFMAGQYINIFTEIDGVRTSRPYSLSSSPRQRAYYEITVARIKTGFVSSFLLDNAKIGDEFQANGPAGVFTFNPIFHSKKSVFLAGGSGITPFMSMTREILEADLDREIFLLYGVRNEKLAIFNEQLSQFAKIHSNFHYELVVSDDENWTGKKGFINASLIKEVVGNVDDCTFYLCGPQIMNDFCAKELESINIPTKRVRREMFGARQDIVNEPGFPKELTGNEIFKVKVGDRVIDAKSSESLLCALERAGIRVNVCCRSGECSLCRVQLVSGKVYLSKGVMARYADQKYGYIHSCKSYPISDLEINL